MRFLSKIAAIILALGAIILLFVATLTNNTEQVLLDRETYLSTVRQQELFNDLLPVTLPALIELSEESDINDFLIDLSTAPEDFDRDDWRYITNELIPPSWLESRFFDTIDILLDSVKGDEGVLDREVSFEDIRERLQGPVATEVAEYIVMNAPPCTRTELDRIRSAANGSSETIPLCNAGELYNSTLTRTIITTFNTIGENLPDNSNNSVREVFMINETNLYVASLVVRIDAQVLLLFYIAPLLLVSLLVFLSVRSFKSLGYWTAFISISTGVLVILAVFFIQLITLGGLIDIAPAQDDITRLLTVLFVNFITSASNSLSGNLIFQAGLYLLVGFVAFLMSNLLPPSEADNHTMMGVGQESKSLIT